MNARTLIIATVFLVVLLGAGYGWKSVTIIADTTPPSIDHDATTHGDTTYPADGKLTVTCIVDETVGMQGVTATLYSGLPPTGSKLEKITLTLQNKLDRDTYRYTGSFTKTLTKEFTYYLTYVATDEAGHTDKFQTSVRLLNLDGYVKVYNGRSWVKVESPKDTITIATLDLKMRVHVTAGADTVADIYCTVDGVKVTGFKKRQDLSTGLTVVWEGTYTLPAEGTHILVIRVTDTAGNEAQFASFTVTVGSQNRLLMVGGAVGVLGVAAAYGYLGKKKIGRRR